MAKVFSLTTVKVVLTNESDGDRITIGGSANLLGSISYEYDKDMFTMESTADGGYVSSFNGSKAGKINIEFKQSSSKISELTNFINKARSNPESAISRLVIEDTLGNIACSANGVFPVKIPTNTVGEVVGSRTFSFIAGEINSNENNKWEE